jgi:hypothetical protein
MPSGNMPIAFSALMSLLAVPDCWTDLRIRAASNAEAVGIIRLLAMRPIFRPREFVAFMI